MPGPRAFPSPSIHGPPQPSKALVETLTHRENPTKDHAKPGVDGVDLTGEGTSDCLRPQEAVSSSAFGVPERNRFSFSESNMC